MRIILILIVVLSSISGYSQKQKGYVLKPDQVFDGQTIQKGWMVITDGNLIRYVGPEKNAPVINDQYKVIDLSGTTLLPGLIEGHGHMFLHPYNETPWNDQVLKESESYRTALATVHAHKTLEAGFTTFRDLGTEGAGYADYGLKKAIEDGVIPGPRLLISSKAIVATGSYGPKGFSTDFDLPVLGAEPADANNLVKIVRSQIGKGADFIKVYADYRWGPNGEAMPTFSEEELRLIVETASSSGRDVAAHAATEEGMRRAINAGAVIIEHGDGGTEEIFALMKDKDIALCPTLAAGHAIMQYGGWDPTTDEEPERIIKKRRGFKMALDAGVTISAGGDIGVFSHGDNVHELEMMVEYGMKPIDVLKSVTSINARLFHLDDQVGAIKEGLIADLTVVKGKPDKDISDLRKVILVVQSGTIKIDFRN